MEKREVRSSRSFKVLVARLEPANARRLWLKAVMADAVGRVVTQSDALERSKAALLSRLHRLGRTFVEHASVTQSGVLLSVSSDSGQLPVYLHQLDANLQEQVTPIVVALLEVQHPTPVDRWISQEESGA